MKKMIATFVFSIFVFSSFAAGDFLPGLKNTAGKKEKLLVIFYKPDCPYCQKMDKLVADDLPFQQKLAENFNIQVFDITSAEGRIMADKFNVHSVPSIVNFNTGDASFTVIKGFAGTGKLLAILGLAAPANEINKEVIILPQSLNNNEFAVCGDGIVEAGEGCDDGNITGSDGCSPTCSVEPGFFCTGSPSVCSSVCGDGIVTPAEGCDDGNTINADGCSATCNTEPGYNCTGSPSVCTSTAPANDNCAGAIALSGSSGIANGQNSNATNSAGVPVPSCQADINSDVWYQFTIAGTRNIRLQANGVSVVDPVLVVYSGTCGSLVQVACDDDSGPGAFSLVQLSLSAGTYFVRVGTYNVTPPGTFSLIYNLNLPGVCGNGIIESGEQCDDGNLANNDNCSNICQVENPATIKGVSVNEDATPAHPSAMLDVKSFDRGVLIPRMSSSQRTAITAPAKGLLVFDNLTNTFWYYNGTGWSEFGGSGGGPGSGLPAGTVNQTLRHNGTAWVPSSVLQNDATNVTVTGQLKINGGVPGIGKVLTSDATGLGNWTQPAGVTNFAASKIDADITVPSANAWTKINFTSVQANGGNAYSGTNSEFTVPVSGFYHFDVKLRFAAFASAPTGFSIALYYRSGANPTGFGYYVEEVIPSTTKTFSATISANLSLSAGDIIDVRVLQTAASGVSVIGSNATGFVTYFSGYKVN